MDRHMNDWLDIQVNGHAGVDFNGDTWTEEELVSCCEDLQQQATGGILATVITAPLDSMQSRIARIANAIAAHPTVAATIRGIHIEGPFLNPTPGYIGAHPTAAACNADHTVAQKLLDAGGGHVKLWTLAPEADPGAKITRKLSDQGLVVAAGHSDASLDQLREAIDGGLQLYTHLGNGCPAELPRHDNIIQRVLSLAEQIKISFIADGHHIPWFALRNYLQIVPSEHTIIVSDAMAAAGLGPGRYRLADQWVEVDEDLSAWAAGRTHFAGSATTLPQMIELLNNNLKVSAQRLRQWTVENPGQLLGIKTD